MPDSDGPVCERARGSEEGRERAQRSEPRERSEPAKRRARGRAGEFERRSPSSKRQGVAKKDASERSEASHANGASRRSGERESVWGSSRGAAPRVRMTPVVELEDLRVKLGAREILHGITRRLGVSGTGKAVGLLGPNGAGKSTLILTLLGFHRPSAGRARILGMDCRRNMGEARSRIGYMPENDSFIGEMTAVTFLRPMAELSGLPAKAALEKAHEVLFHVGLGESGYREVRAYSYGMKQMAKLAQAIVHGPELVVLDEPTNGLDPAARRRMLKLVADMKEEQGMNVLVC